MARKKGKPAQPRTSMHLRVDQETRRRADRLQRRLDVSGPELARLAMIALENQIATHEAESNGAPARLVKGPLSLAALASGEGRAEGQFLTLSRRSRRHRRTRGIALT